MASGAGRSGGPDPRGGAQGPDGARGPNDRPGFGWLYDGRPDSTPGEADAEERTRMLPVQRRPGPSGSSGPRAGSPSTAAPTGPPTAQRPVASPIAPATTPRPTPIGPAATNPAGGPARGNDYRSGGGFGGFVRRRLTRPRFYVRTVLLLVLVLIVYSVAVPIFTFKSMHEVAWEPNGTRPDQGGGTNYLLVGSDSRAGLDKAQRREYHTGDTTENLADTIMILHTGSGPNVLLSVPRDSYVDIPGYGDGSKINSAFAKGGAKLLTHTIEADTGIRIDHYVQIGLGGVASVVDAVGGIQVCPAYRMDDADAGLHIKKGCQQVDGQVALAYSRSRHAQHFGDLDRVKHQREVVAAIGHKVLSPWSVLNPIRWWKLNHAVPDFFRFGQGMGTADIVRWASAMSHTTGSKGLTCTMPVTDLSAEHWDMTRAKPLFAAIIGNDTDKITKRECTPAGIVGAK